MDIRLRHYHLGCGQRLQTSYTDFESELRIRFQEVNKIISERLNENKNIGSISPRSSVSNSGKAK